MIDRPGLPEVFGREAELMATRAFFDRLDCGSAGLVLSGRPGVGKTSLWSGAVAMARAAGRRVITTRPVEADAQLAFAGLRDLIGEAAPEVLSSLPPPQRDALAVVLLLEPPSSGPGDPAVIVASVSSALRVLRDDRTLVVAVDDAQWLDEPTRTALAFALRRIADEGGVGLLATSRSSDRHVAADLAAVLPWDVVERVEVGPLSVAALHRTVVDRLGVRLRRPTLTRLHEMSGGNPLFALEIVRGLGDDAELAVPCELTALLRARLAVLSPRTAEVAMMVAALSRPTRTLLAQIAGDVDMDLDEAATAEILELDGDTVRFTHPLLASVHLGTASPERRRTLHARIAAAVGDVEERARHLARAVSGPDDDVAAVLDEAVKAAGRRGALQAAAALAADAAALTPLRSAARHRRILTAIDLACRSGDADGAAGLVSAALSADPEPCERAELLLACGRVEQGRHPHSARDAFRSALELVAEDSPLRVQLYVELAAAEYSLGHPDVALTLAQAAEPVAERLGDPSLLALAVGGVAFFETDRSGELQAARYERAMALEEAAGCRVGEASAAFDYAQQLLEVWELERARAVLDPLVTQARADGSADLAERLDNMAFVELCAGRLLTASALAHEAVELASQLGRTIDEVYASFRLGWIEGLRGNVSAAEEACDRSLRLAAMSNGFTRGARLSLGYLESSLECYDAAWSYLDPEDPATGELPAERPVVHVPEMVEVLAGLGRTDEARAKLAPFTDRSSALHRRWALARAAHCRGLILLAEGELESGAAALEDAVAQGAANGWPIPLGRSLLALGESQRRRRRKAEARRTLERAVELFEGAGAVIWCDRARRELGRIGGRRAPANDQLSSTELEITRRVATGCSNKAIADQLHISDKTVEWNLSKIYRKIGVRSRSELIARGGWAGKSGDPPG